MNTVNLRNRWVHGFGWAAAAVALLVTIGTGGSTAPEPATEKAPRPEAASLRVEVAGLSPGVDAKVTVSGADGTRYTITDTDERSVPPGGYSVVISQVHGNAITHYPADDRHRVQVAQGRRTTTTAAYRIAIPDSTEVLDPADPAITRIQGREIHLVADSAVADRLSPGDHVVSGIGPRVPHMLVRRVEGISREDEQIVVDTTEVALDEALPAWVVRYDTADGLDNLRPAGHTATAGAGSPAARTIAAGTLQSDPLAEVEFSLDAEGGACSEADDAQSAASVHGSVGYQLDDADLDLDGEIAFDPGVKGGWNPLNWEVDPSLTAIAEAELSMEHSIRADIEAALDCEVTVSRDLLDCDSMGGHLLKVGPIEFSCEFTITGRASVETTATWHTDEVKAETALGLELGFDTEEEGFHADPSLSADLIGPPLELPEHRSEFGASLGFRAALTAEDPLPEVEAKVAAGVEVSAGPTVRSTPDEFSADLDLSPKLVAEAEVDLIVDDWDGRSEFPFATQSFELWDISRSDPLPSPSPSPTPPSPSPSRSSPPAAEAPPFFVGHWWSHNSSGRTRHDGTGGFTWRDYDYHGSDPDLAFHHIEVVLQPEADAMVGTIIQSTSADIPKGTPIRLERVDRYSVEVYVDGDAGRYMPGSFCKDHAPAGYCGA